MRRLCLILLILVFLGLACSSPVSTDQESPEPAPQSEGRCGDDVCDGPENPGNCPQDCPAGVINAPVSNPESETAEEQTAPADPDDNQQLEQAAESDYRYISFSGMISTTLNEEPMGDFTGTAFEYAADYSIELWFPMTGGKAVQQRNTIALTEFRDLYYGDLTCTPCEWNLDASAYEPVSFELDAALTLEGIMEGDEVADELVYQLSSPPLKTITGTALCPCPGSVEGDISDPVAYLQLFSWFMQGITDPVHLHTVSSSSVDMFPISPMSYINIPEQNMSYVIVPDLDTP